MFCDLVELIEKIHTGNDPRIEFKRALPDRNNLADDIAAFANAQGGAILIGIDEHRTIVGIDRKCLDITEKTVVDVCLRNIDTTVHVFTEKLRLDDKNLLRIEVPRSHFVHKSPSGYLIRAQGGNREMPTDQLARLFLDRARGHKFSFDAQPVPYTHKDTLGRDHYKRFIPEAREEDEVQELLCKRRLLVKEGKDDRASVAGVLMCHDSPDEYLYNSFIQAVYYSGLRKDTNYQIDAKDFRGPLDQQIVDAFKFVERYNQVSARKEIGRIERSQYSMRAVLEALVNAVVHRDYSKAGSKIRLFMFTDRLELYSPGALANSLTVDDLPYNQATRNELLARLLSETTLDDNMKKHVARRHFLERRGEGVGIILNESKALSGKTPLYELFGEELRLAIFAASSLQDNDKT